MKSSRVPIRLLRWAGIGFAAFVVSCVLLWCLLTHYATGYDPNSPQLHAARRMARLTLAPSPHGVDARRALTAKPTPAGIATATPKSATASVSQVLTNTLHAPRRPSAKSVDFVEAVRGLDRRARGSDGKYIYRICEFWSSRQVFDAGRSPIRMNGNAIELEPSAQRAVANEVTSVTVNRPLRRSSCDPFSTQSLTRMLEGVDAVEDFLLRSEWRVPPYPFRVLTGGLDQFAALAILRADLRGDGSKEVELALRYCEASRIADLGYWLCARDGDEFSPPVEPLLILGECRHFPLFEKRRILSALGRRIMTPEQLASFVDLRGALVIRDLQESTDLTRIFPVVSARGSIREMLDGKVQAGARRAINPVALQVAKTAVSLRLKGEEVSPLLLSGFRVLCEEGMNVYVDPSGLDNPDKRVGDGGHGIFEANQSEADWKRLTFATAAWRRENGRYPAHISDLRPDELLPKAGSGYWKWGAMRLSPRPGSPDTIAFYYVCDLWKNETIVLNFNWPVAPLVDRRIIDALR